MSSDDVSVVNIVVESSPGDGSPPPTQKELLENQADNPEKIQGALNDAAGASSALWISFISFSAYLAVTVGSISHQQLLLKTPIRLPLLNVDLPLIAFSWVAPSLLLVFHLYLLWNLNVLDDRIRLQETIACPAKGDVELEKRLRAQLTTFVIAQRLSTLGAGSDLVGRLPAVISWITVVAGPLALLLLLQLEFLPYHSSLVTWVHRIALLVDLSLLWLLLPQPGSRPTRTRVVGVVLAAMLALFSTLVATFPGEPQDQNRLATASSLYQLLFLGPVNADTGRRNSLWSNTLVLIDQDLVDGDKFKTLEINTEDLDEMIRRGERTITLRGRDLRGAVLAHSRLPLVDFTNSNLQDVDFSGAYLEGARFKCERLETTDSGIFFASHGCNEFGGARFSGAKLRRMTLEGGNLEGVAFDGADLKLASVRYSHLEGANLRRADLRGASLESTWLMGAIFTSSRLGGANLAGADFIGARLNEADLEGATLYRTKLAGTDMYRANLQGALLRETELFGADLGHAQFQGATIMFSQMQGAKFTAADFSDAALLSSWFWRARGSGVKSGSLTSVDVATPASTDFDASYTPDHGENIDPWTKQAYEDISAEVQREVKAKEMRADATERIGILDPAKTAVAVDDVLRQTNFVKFGSPTHDRTLQARLLTLGCADPDIFRGLINNGRIAAAGRGIAAAIEAVLTAPDAAAKCPATVHLTVGDRSVLHAIATGDPDAASGS